MANASKIISRLYTARKTLLELLSTRGYEVEGYANFGVNEVNAMYTHKQLDMLVEIKGEQKSKGSKSKGDKGEKGKKDKDVVETENKKTYVKFHLEKTLSVSHINDLIEDLYVLGVGGEIGGTGLSANANDTVLTEKDTLIIITKQEIKTMNQVLNQLSLQGRFIVPTCSGRGAAPSPRRPSWGVRRRAPCRPRRRRRTTPRRRRTG